LNRSATSVGVSGVSALSLVCAQVANQGPVVVLPHAVGPLSLGSMLDLCVPTAFTIGGSKVNARGVTQYARVTTATRKTNPVERNPGVERSHGVAEERSDKRVAAHSVVGA
jgi:hypothetical protein